MGGKGDLVNYTSIFKEGPLKPADKKELKEKINAIIDAASDSITVQALVKPSDEALRKELEKREKQKEKGG